MAKRAEAKQRMQKLIDSAGGDVAIVAESLERGRRIARADGHDPAAEAEHRTMRQALKDLTGKTHR
jgi:hypothetical protein